MKYESVELILGDGQRKTVEMPLLIVEVAFKKDFEEVGKVRETRLVSYFKDALSSHEGFVTYSETDQKYVTSFKYAYDPKLTIQESFDKGFTEEGLEDYPVRKLYKVYYVKA